jgi:hypothetical protein
MDIKNVKEICNLLGLEYKTEEWEENLSYINIVTGYNSYEEKIIKTIYFNPKTDLVIPKYEEKLKIKEQIKKLQEELKKIEEN